MGVPLTLGALGAPCEDGEMAAFLDGIFRPGGSISSLSRLPSRERMRNALLEADAMGRAL